MNRRKILKPLVFALLLCVPFAFSYAYGNPAEEEYILYGVTRYLLLYYNPKSITSNTLSQASSKKKRKSTYC